YAHMDLAEIDLDLRTLYISMDSIRGDLRKLNFKEQSGLEINKLETEFTYTNTGVLLEDLFLQTPNTLLRDHVQITYPSLAALSENPELMGMEVNLKNGTLGMKDIVLLVPML